MYVGGQFIYAGGTNATNNIAHWDGTDWLPMEQGIPSQDGEGVLALAVSGSNVYAGGDFTIIFTNGAGFVSANHIAEWDGHSWSVLGSGANSYVEALTLAGTNLYVGGAFTNAGNQTAYAVAEATGVNGPAVTILPGLTGGQLVARFTGTPGVAFTVESTPDLSPSSWGKLTNVVAPQTDMGLGAGVVDVPLDSGGTNGFFRAVYPAY